MIKQRNITLIVVHCTASPCTSNLTPEALDSMHKRQGFAECGYHYYITKDGTIHHMRDITHIGAHAKGYNTPSIGVAYEGGLDASGRAADTRTDAQKQSLETLLRFLLLTYHGSKDLRSPRPLARPQPQRYHRTLRVHQTMPLLLCLRRIRVFNEE